MFYYVVAVRSKCSGTPIEAAWNRSGEVTIISVSMIDVSTVISYLKRILHTYVALYTCASARRSVVSLLSSCGVWGTDHVTLDVRLDVQVRWCRGCDVKMCENLQMNYKCEVIRWCVLCDRVYCES